MQSSKLTGLLLSVEILGDQSGTQNQHQQRNDESLRGDRGLLQAQRTGTSSAAVTRQTAAKSNK